jgi:hypothetical protein
MNHHNKKRLMFWVRLLNQQCLTFQWKQVRVAPHKASWKSLKTKLMPVSSRHVLKERNIQHIFRGQCTPILLFVFPIRLMRLITDRYFCHFIDNKTDAEVSVSEEKENAKFQLYPAVIVTHNLKMLVKSNLKMLVKSTSAITRIKYCLSVYS